MVVAAAAVGSTSGRCRPEAERHSAAARREHSATGAVVIGAVATGAVVIGAGVIGAAGVGAAGIGAAPMANPFLSADLVFRSSTGIPITGTIRTVTNTIITASPVTATATTAIQGTATTATKGTATAATKGTTATTNGTATAATKGTATAIPGYRKSDRRRRDAANKWRLVQKLLLFEFARVLVRFDHVASSIVNANHGIMWSAVEFCVSDCIADCIWPGVTTAARMAAHLRLDRLRDGPCAGEPRKRGCRKPRSIESITIRLPSEFLKPVLHSLLFQAASIFANQRS